MTTRDPRVQRRHLHRPMAYPRVSTWAVLFRWLTSENGVIAMTIFAFVVFALVIVPSTPTHPGPFDPRGFWARVTPELVR